MKYPLTTPQVNIWSLRQCYPNTGITNICGSILFREQLDAGLLERAINEVAESQEALRLRFSLTREGLMQEPSAKLPSVKRLAFPSVAQLHEYGRRLAQTPRPLVEACPWEFTIVHLPERVGILMCADHLVADAWTISLLAKQVYEAYVQLATESDSAQNGLKTYAYDAFYAKEQEYLGSKAFLKDGDFWKEQYREYSGPGSLRPETSSAKTPRAERLETHVDESLSRLIRDFEVKRGYSPAIIFEAAVSLYLSRINHMQNVSLGCMVLNRATRMERNTAGMFVSTVPARIDCTGCKTVRDLLEAIVAAHRAIFRHQRYPYRYIAEDVRKRFVGADALYDVIVSYQNAETNVPADTTWYPNGSCEAPLEMHVDNRDSGSCLTLSMDYEVELFPASEIELLRERVLYLVSQIVTSPNASLDDLDILPTSERAMVVEAFNQTAVPRDGAECVHELVSKQARMCPDREAVVFSGRKVTYLELEERSDALAARLIDLGIQPGDVIGAFLDRSELVVVAQLAVLKAGGVFLPIDRRYPQDRITYMTDDCDVRAVLVDRPTELEWNAPVFDISSIPCVSETPFIPPRGLGADSPCYVIYTSGSTGKPKGCLLTQRGLTNFCARNNIAPYVDRLGAQRMVSVNTISFDYFIAESLLPLSHGWTVVMASEEESVKKEEFRDLVIREQVNIVATTPTRLKIYTKGESAGGYFGKIDVVVSSGEELDGGLREHIEAISSAKIFNPLGPSECSVWVLGGDIGRDTTLGRPIANAQAYVLDNQLSPAPVGIPGELCIAGDSVGLGYINQPELTATRFISNPFATRENGHGAKLYRTGDLVRWRTDGEMEYLGRIDTQVKIHGLRIELGEIEHALLLFPGIQLSAAADKRDPKGRQHLVGYYTAEQAIDEHALRIHLAKKLPRYMVPSWLVALPQMPLTASGKIDRKALPTPTEGEPRVFRDGGYCAPETDLQKTLCSVLGSVLHIESVGVDDDFFSLGGDSLSAIEYMAAAHNQDVEFSLQDVFDHPTVRKLCTYMEQGARMESDINPARFEKYAPLLACNEIDELWRPTERSLKNVFLTGATGFLGAHILDAVLRHDTGTIYCLVRQGENQLADVLHYYFGKKYDAEIGRRIRCVTGDITDESIDERIPDCVDTFIHAAATVKHYGPYAYFNRVNVEGTARIAACALKRHAQMIHISTTSVSGNSFADAFDVVQGSDEIDFTERHLYAGQPLGNVYARSKFEAECAVMDAVLEGLQGRIVRVGNLTNRRSDAKFQPNYDTNAFLMRFRAALDLGFLPDYLKDTPLEFSYVDQTALGIVRIAQCADRQTVFHLNNNKEIPMKALVGLLEPLGVTMNFIEGNEFNRLLHDMAKNQGTEAIYEAFMNDLDDDGNLAYDSKVHIVNDFTVWFMNQIGFDWDEVTAAYISEYIRYFRNLGYFSL